MPVDRLGEVAADRRSSDGSRWWAYSRTTNGRAIGWGSVLGAGQTRQWLPRAEACRARARPCRRRHLARSGPLASHSPALPGRPEVSPCSLFKLLPWPGLNIAPGALTGGRRLALGCTDLSSREADRFLRRRRPSGASGSAALRGIGGDPLRAANWPSDWDQMRTCRHPLD